MLPYLQDGTVQQLCPELGDCITSLANSTVNAVYDFFCQCRRISHA